MRSVPPSLLLQFLLLLAIAAGVYSATPLEDAELRILDEAKQLQRDVEILRVRRGLRLPTTRTPQWYNRGPLTTMRTPQWYNRGPLPTMRTPQWYNRGPLSTTRTPQRQQNYGQQQQLNRRPQTNNGNKSQLNVQGVFQRTNYTRKKNATFTNETNGAFVSYVCYNGSCVRQYSAGFYSTVSVGGLVALIVLAVIVVVFARRSRTEMSIISDVDSRPLLGGGGIGGGSRSTLSIQCDPIVVGNA